MDSHQWTNIMLQSELLGDATGGFLSRGQGAPEMPHKSALLEDMRFFETMDRKGKYYCCTNTLKREMLLEIAIDRARWRKVVKADMVYAKH